MESRRHCGFGALAVLLLALSTSVGASTALDLALGDTSSCAERCAINNNGTKNLLSACSRGCRLFAICQFVDDGRNLHDTRRDCEAACTEAYNNAAEEESCIAGCQFQQPLAELRQQQLATMLPHMHTLSVLGSSWARLLDSAHGLLSSSWTFYLQADDGRVVVFQSQPGLYLEYQEKVSDGLDEPHKSQLDAQVRTDTSSKSQWDTNSHSADAHDHHGFLMCMARRSGLPRWVLAFTLVLSIIVLLWICCATTVTAPDHHVPAAHVCIKLKSSSISTLRFYRFMSNAIIADPWYQLKLQKLAFSSRGFVFYCILLVTLVNFIYLFPCPLFRIIWGLKPSVLSSFAMV
uniref:Transmembrane protein 59-like n=1 Tax=Eptatretus burgeri TaxID=7764 RepID=A0A8C4R5W0_EPTBU